MEKEEFDFWYAVNNTEIIRKPSGQLETFGTTVLNYFLLTEIMDRADQIRIREGRITAGQPRILTPGSFASEALDGFGDDAQEYLDWLRSNEQNLKIIEYGFHIQKQELNEHVVTESMQTVLHNVAHDADKLDDPLMSVLVGVDHPWEVCLLKLLREVVHQSAPGNVRDFQQSNLLPIGKADMRQQLENDFLNASRNHDLIDELGTKLHHLGLFPEFEDRFFSLVQQRGGKTS